MHKNTLALRLKNSTKYGVGFEPPEVCVAVRDRFAYPQVLVGFDEMSGRILGETLRG